jgi:hypothetical protein
VPAIETALEYRQRALVVGIYLSTTAARIHSRSAAATRSPKPAADPFPGKNVALSEGAIIQHPEFLNCVVDTAYAAIAPGAARQPIVHDGALTH